MNRKYCKALINKSSFHPIVNHPIASKRCQTITSQPELKQYTFLLLANPGKYCMYLEDLQTLRIKRVLLLSIAN